MNIAIFLSMISLIPLSISFTQVTLMPSQIKIIIMILA